MLDWLKEKLGFCLPDVGIQHDTWMAEHVRKLRKASEHNVMSPETKQKLDSITQAQAKLSGELANMEDQLQPNRLRTYKASCYDEILQYLYTTGVLTPDMHPDVQHGVIMDLLTNQGGN